MSDGWIDVDEARGRGGLRLVLTRGVPGPWGESAKGIFHVKGIAFARVEQRVGEPNDALHAWTGCRNAPVAVFDDERPRSGWAEILWLAERLAPDPPLVPRDPAERALMFGLGHEICGERGFGWSRRLMLIDSLLSRLDEATRAAPPPALAIPVELGHRYGWSPEEGAAAPARTAEILRLLSDRLLAQRERGSRFFVGDRLSALDVWWAAFAALVEPLPDELCPLAPGMRATYTLAEGAVRDALHPILLDHRRRIYEEFLELPVLT